MLGHAFRTMSERLRAMVGEVSSTAGTLSVASTEAGGDVRRGRARGGRDRRRGRRRRRRRRAPGPRRGVRRARVGDEVAESARAGAAHAAGTVAGRRAGPRDGRGGHSRRPRAPRAAMDAVRTADARGHRDDPRARRPQRAHRRDRGHDHRASPSRPTCSRSTPPSRPPARASRARASRSSPTRSASSPRSPSAAAGTIAELIAEIQAETARAVGVVEEGARRTDDGVATVAAGQQGVRGDPRRHRRRRPPGRRDRGRDRADRARRRADAR